MLTKSNLSKGHNIIALNSLWLSTLKLNSGIFPSKYRINSPTIYKSVVYVQCEDEGEQRRNYPANTRKIHEPCHEKMCFLGLSFLP